MRRLGRTRRPRRRHQPRAHGIDPDAVGRKLVRQRAREAEEAGFCGHDMRSPRRTRMRAQPSDVHDDPRPRSLEMRQAGLHAVEGAIEDDGGDRAPLRHRHFVERLLCAHGSIVDQNVDAAEMRGGGGHHFFDRDRVGDVGNRRNGLATRPGDLAGNISRLHCGCCAH